MAASNVMIDNERTRVTMWSFKIGEETGQHIHEFDYVIVPMSNGELKIINDQIGCPTAAFDIAKTILELGNKIFLQRPKVKWGTFHYCGDTKLSWYEFACEIFRLAEDPLGVKTPKLYPVSTDEYPTIATRPSYSVLDCSRIGRVFGIYPAPFLNSLSHVIGELKTLDNIEIQKS